MSERKKGITMDRSNAKSVFCRRRLGGEWIKGPLGEKEGTHQKDEPINGTEMFQCAKK